VTYVELDRTILAELVDLEPVEGLRLVRELVEIFFQEAPGRLDRMRCGLSLGDSAQVTQGAHALKGAASGLGATGMAAACGRVERQARSGFLMGLDVEVDRIETELPRLARRVEGLIAQLARTAPTE
jgi:HPt (histidine-containing phosphotransfer) domain-containing protein